MTKLLEIGTSQRIIDERMQGGVESHQPFGESTDPDGLKGLIPGPHGPKEYVNPYGFDDLKINREGSPRFNPERELSTNKYFLPGVKRTYEEGDEVSEIRRIGGLGGDALDGIQPIETGHFGVSRKLDGEDSLFGKSLEGIDLSKKILASALEIKTKKPVTAPITEVSTQDRITTLQEAGEGFGISVSVLPVDTREAAEASAARLNAARTLRHLQNSSRYHYELDSPPNDLSGAQLHANREEKSPVMIHDSGDPDKLTADLPAYWQRVAEIEEGRSPQPPA